MKRKVTLEDVECGLARLIELFECDSDVSKIKREYDDDLREIEQRLKEATDESKTE